MPPKPKPVKHAKQDPAALALFELIKVHAALVGLSSRLTHLWHEVRRMPVNPEVQAALDNVKTAITNEADQIRTKVQATIDAINAGQDPTEIVSQLNDIVTAVDALSEALPTSPTAPPSPPTP
jgi:hypothetical protein